MNYSLLREPDDDLDTTGLYIIQVMGPRYDLQVQKTSHGPRRTWLSAMTQTRRQFAEPSVGAVVSPAKGELPCSGF
jgi:hypothetical protein